MPKKVAVTFFFMLGGLLAAGAVYAMLRPRVAPQPSSAAEPQSAPAANASTIYFVKNPEPTPAFQAKDIAGKPVSTADWKNKAVLLNFWATWCPPCREEIPTLIALQKKYEGRLLIIGISEDEGDPAQVAAYAKRMGINYPLVMATPELIGKWGGVEALPTTFLISPQGRVMGKNRGLRSLADYDMEVRALLGDKVEARIETIADQGQVFLKNAANATELPDVSFAGLTPEQKALALHRLNAEGCTCGCKLTISQCRLNDSTCPVSKTMAAQIVSEVKQKAPATVKGLAAK